MAVLWWVWFDKAGDQQQRRQAVLATLLGCLVAVAVARVLGWVWPFRVRPVNNATLAFHLPCGMAPQGWLSWNAFPSDHATFFVGLATGLFALSRTLGLVGLGYALAFICLLRIYLGLHYPTDILGGALLGMAMVGAAHWPRIKQAITLPGLRWERSYPGLFYACAFLFSYETSILFDDVRHIITAIRDLLRLHSQTH